MDLKSFFIGFGIVYGDELFVVFFDFLARKIIKNCGGCQSPYWSVNYG
jgi:hypothetical protein